MQASHKSDEVLERLPLTTENLDSRGLYIYDNGFNFVIWFGRMLFPDIVTSILGVDFSTFPDLSRVFFLTFSVNYDILFLPSLLPYFFHRVNCFFEVFHSMSFEFNLYLQD